jgi:tetratricopeptide (TPR) repeat protein
MRADAKAAQGSYNLALQDINTAISIAGDDNYYELNARGVMYGRSGRYKKAMTDFNECIAKKPDCPDTYINIGNMLMLQKKYAEAEQQYTKAISLDPNNMAAYNNRGNAREMQFDLDGAESDFEMYNKLKQR